MVTTCMPGIATLTAAVRLTGRPIALLKVAASVAVWPGAMVAGLAMKLWIVASDAVATPGGLQASIAKSRAVSASCRNIADLRLRIARRVQPPGVDFRTSPGKSLWARVCRKGGRSAHPLAAVFNAFREPHVERLQS